MAKFRVKMKLTGFELEIEGSREDVPLIAQNLGQQLGGLLAPATHIVEAEVVQDPPTRASQAENSPPSDSTKRRKPRRSSPRPPQPSSPNASANETAVQWRHDTAKYGSPRQEWGGTNKSLWLLYVAGEETDVKEMSGLKIMHTFNTHFRTSGQLRAHNVNRDLAKLKVSRDGEPPFISEDTTKTPPAWFLTDAGRKAAQKLVDEALGKNK
jgi:hypothetical protein